MLSLKEIKNQVKSLINSEKWHEAYQICNEVLKHDPSNSDFNSLKNIIEYKVKAINIKAIKAELKSLEPLLKTENYQEYLLKIHHLYSSQDDFPEIKEIIYKVNKLWEEQKQKQKEDLIKKEIQTVKNLKDITNLNEIVNHIQQLMKLGIYQRELQNLINKVKQQWIDREIQANQSLLKSQKYEDIIIFLLKLKHIYPESEKILKLIDQIKEQYQYYKIDLKKDFIYKTQEEIKQLYSDKVYDKAIILCEKILDIDPRNSLALDYYKNCQEDAENMSTKQIEQSIFNKYRLLKASKIDFSKDNYVTI